MSQALAHLVTGSHLVPPPLKQHQVLKPAAGMQERVNPHLSPPAFQVKPAGQVGGSCSL